MLVDQTRVEETEVDETGINPTAFILDKKLGRLFQAAWSCYYYRAYCCIVWLFVKLD